MRRESKLKELARERGLSVRALLERTSNSGSLTLVETARRLGLPKYAISFWLKSMESTWKRVFREKEKKEKGTETEPYKAEVFVPLYPKLPDLIKITRN